MACCTVGRRFRDGGAAWVLLSSLGLSPGPQGVAGAGHEGGVGGTPVPPVTSCKFIATASVSRARLLSTTSCSRTPARSCVRVCRCRAPTRHGAADLVQHRRRTLLPGRVDDVRFRARDRGELAAPVEPRPARLVRCRDGGGVGQPRCSRGGRATPRRMPGSSCASALCSVSTDG